MASLNVTWVLALLSGMALAQSAPQQAGQPKEKCVVTGRVTNALTGEPIKKAEVHLDYANRQNPMSAPQGYGGMADAGGNFRFEGIEPGEHSLRRTI